MEAKIKDKNCDIVNPYWRIIVGIVSISCSAIFIKFASAPPIVTAFYRMLFTVIILTPFILIILGKDKRIMNLTVKIIINCSLSGVFLALHFAFWITSLNYTSITSSTVLVTLQPLFVVLGEYLIYREPIGYRSVIGVLVTVCGGIILGYGDISFGSNVLLGDLFALTGSIFIACYILIGKNIRKQLDLLPYTYIVYLSASIVLFLGNAFITKNFLTGYPLTTWGWFVALAVVPNIMGQSIFSWALKHVKATVVSISILGEPVGATILTFIIWGQVPGMCQILGGILIIMGLVMILLLSQSGLEKNGFFIET